MKIVIVGVTKCGTTSLKEYLIKLGHEVINHQTLATIPSGTWHFNSEYRSKGYKPALIFRNYDDRMRSFRAFYTDYGGSVKDSKGQSDRYDRHNIISQWSGYDPLIFTLESLIHEPSFMRLNSRA